MDAYPQYPRSSHGTGGRAPDHPGHQTLCRFFAVFSRTRGRGPPPRIPGPGRAPPGGHGWRGGPLARLELRTLNFFPLFPHPGHRGRCQAALPGEERHQAATAGTAAPWPPWSSGLCTFFQLFPLFPPPGHRGRCQAALPGGRAPPAGHGWLGGPLATLELSTLSLFPLFYDFNPDSRRWARREPCDRWHHRTVTC